MIDAISNLPTYIDSTETKKADSGELGKDQFLKLFLAQLNHQDPLNPMDSSEFSSQLAQFSSLEQLFNVNDNLELMKAAQDDTGRYQALDLIGKEVEASGDIIFLDQGGHAKGGFSIPGNSYCSVSIVDSSGFPVRTLDLGVLEAGNHTLQWDGFDNNGNILGEGLYGFEIEAITDSGLILPVETRIRGQVDRVNLEGDTPMLYVGEIPLAFSQILDIEMPESEGETGETM